jgi:transaldolase
MKVAVAFDHRGVKLRERLFAELTALGHEAVDLGTDKPEPRIDYPDKAREVGEALRAGEAERAVLVCGSGVGASVAANKLAGVRAAVCHDTYSAHQGVEHDDMNVLCLGSEVIGAELGAELVRAFLGARFDGGEPYVRRLEKIEEMEGEKMPTNQSDDSDRVDRSFQTDARAEPARPDGGADERRLSESRLQQLSELGQSVWIDYLSRRLVHGGELERLMREHAVVGVTSNPTIFQKAIAEGDAYDEQLREVLARQDDPKEAFLELAVRDVQDACDLLRKVWDGGHGKDGYVSIEVDPALADDTEATIAEAQRLHELVDRPNCFVKIPATQPGLPAIEEMIARGRNINVTLIFSLDRYSEVAEAYLRGLERLVEAGGDPSGVASVASFFVSRVDTEADRRLDEAGAPPELKGKLAVANAKLAYQRYKELFAGARWEALGEKGARTQRCLWASTSTKNPDYRDVLYVEELIGPETVNTMPEETIQAFEDHGEVALTLECDLEEAQRVFDRVAEAGVDYDDVVMVLEREGVQKFSDSFAELLDGVRAKRGELVSA